MSRYELLKAATDLLSESAARPVYGQDVLELLPFGGRTPDDAIRTVEDVLQERVRKRVFTVYLATDAADDSTIEAVARRGATAIIGRRRNAGIPRLGSPQSVDGLLESIISNCHSRYHCSGTRDVWPARS